MPKENLFSIARRLHIFYYKHLTKRFMQKVSFTWLTLLHEPLLQYTLYICVPHLFVRVLSYLFLCWLHMRSNNRLLAEVLT